MEKEVELLSRVAVNHLFLGQFEPFRAAVLSLRRRDPAFACSLLREVVARAGRIDGVLPSPSCPSPSHLAWLSALELVPDHDDNDALRSKAEFLLLAQLAASRSPESSVSPVLDRILEVGVRRLCREFGGGGGEGFSVGVEDEAALRKAVLDEAEVFDAMCAIAKNQAELPEPVANPETAITLSDGASDGDLEALRWLLKNVQMAHLVAIKKCLEEGDDNGALSHLRFLHLDHGVEHSEYKYMLLYVLYSFFFMFVILYLFHVKWVTG